VLFQEAALIDDEEIPILDQMIESVLRARDDGEVSSKTVRADLYIRTYEDTEYFFEMKSPVPNKDICLVVTERILYFHLLRGLPRPKVQAYYAMAYNPYGAERADYNWSVGKVYLPFEQGTLIGQEFWNIVGGPATYEELLDIYAEVGHDKSKYIIESLTLGF
jgi:hypothetical protein